VDVRKIKGSKKMKGLGYLIGELGASAPDPYAEIKKEITAYTRNPKQFMAQKTIGEELLSIPTTEIKINFKPKESLTDILTKPMLIDVPLSEFGKKPVAEIKRNLKKGVYSRNKPLTQDEQNKKLMKHINDTIQLNATEPAGSGNFDEPQNWHLTYPQYEEAKMKLEADQKEASNVDNESKDEES
jgi:hypothetical protein